jgi:hypothetical protein
MRDDDHEVRLMQITDTLALMAERLANVQDLLERIAVGLGVDPNAPLDRR